jgi:deoxyribose-phosphate aldolase
MPTYRDLAKMIDHSLLKPMLTAAELDAGCLLARAHDVASVCILPYYLERAVKLLEGSDVLPTTTVGFPHGGHTTFVKLTEAEQALDHGARELDMVVNVSAVKSADWEHVRNDIEAVLSAVRSRGQKLKVIFENAYLTDEEKIQLCEICGDLSVDWVKTSTGYAATGATIPDLLLMRRHSPPHVQVKAAGGVADLEMLLRVREAGATRSGSSATAAILGELRRRLDAGEMIDGGSAGMK